MAQSSGEKIWLKKRRSRVLWEITALVAAVYIIGGLAAFFIARSSYNRLAQKSTDKLIEEKAETISSSYDYLAESEMEKLLKEYGVENIDRSKLYDKLLKKDPEDLDPLQEYLIREVVRMRESGLLGLEYIFMVIPPNIFTPKPITFVSNDRSLLYLDLPGPISEAIAEGKSYIILKEGLPELGLSGEQLITFTKIASPVSQDVLVTFTGITPMGKDVADIRGFYDEEKRSTMVRFGLAVIIGVAAIILITFFLLRYLIRLRITQPIEILCGEAEEVLEGNLDIEVVVHRGGEFEGLETAFRKMVESFRKYIAKSIGED